jgi:hypothetical protein
LKEISKRMEETSSDSDRMFLLFLAMKQLSPLDNMDFRVEIQETFQQKLRHLAAPEADRISKHIISSPALSE